MCDVLDEEEGSECPFQLFTQESLFEIHKKIGDEEADKKIHKHAVEEGEEEESPHHEDDEKKPNPKLDVGKKLPLSMKDDFPPEFIGKPIEDIDDFYDNKLSFMVIGKDHTMYRFSAKNALFLLSPFNPLRKLAVYILVHPVMIILTIIVNCVFMALTEIPEELEFIETVFTAVYTVEAVVKIIARGFIIDPFTYLRDPWNWLDFLVIGLAYLTMFIDLGNLSALRTFRVLRALKTVAVIPGLKTIVGALLEAVRRLRDVGILTVFMLSIFALVGMQLYMGALKHKCVKDSDNHTMDNETWWRYVTDRENWDYVYGSSEPKMCGNTTGAGRCPQNYTCLKNLETNPNFNYTSFDNFGVALLCAFRLMTQDYWENLYWLILRAEGPWHCIYFMTVILLGSFYLVNLILAIVAMSYDETQKQDIADAAEEEAERRDDDFDIVEDKQVEEIKREDELNYRKQIIDDILSQREELTKSPSSVGDQVKGELDDKLSIQSEKHENNLPDNTHLTVTKPSYSLPGSPFVRRTSRSKKSTEAPIHPERQPLVPTHYFDHLNLPFADESNPVTPCSDDLCNLPTYKFMIARRGSFASRRSLADARSRRNSLASLISRASLRRSRRQAHHSPLEKPGKLDNPWNWNKSKGDQLLPEVVVDKTKSDDNETDSISGGKPKTHTDNLLVCRTPSIAGVDPKDLMLLNQLLNDASGGHRKSFMSELSGEKETLKDRFLRIFCSWECCKCYLVFQKYVRLFILDAFVDLFITLCILVNTAFMAADHYGMSKELTNVLEKGNYVFTVIFAAEAFLKVIALNPLTYIKDGWNCFDAVIVLLSFLELMLGGSGLSVLRSFRLLRVFKLAKSWQTLNMLISIVARTLGALGNLTFVLGIVVFIFAVMGQQLFADSYTDKFQINDSCADCLQEELPYWNFTDFLHSFMIVFRVLCGEWIESMWNCQRVFGPACVPFFLLTMVIGNLVVLNLFLALLLSAFDSSNLQTSTSEEEEPNKLAEAFDRFARFGNWVKVHIIVCIKSKTQKRPPKRAQQQHLEMNGKEMLADGQTGPMGNGKVCTTNPTTTTDDTDHDQVTTPTATTKKGGAVCDSPDGDVTSDAPTLSRTSTVKCPRGSASGSSVSSLTDDSASKGPKKVDIDGEPEIHDVEVVMDEYPDDCWCQICRKKCACCIRMENTEYGKRWWNFRVKMFRLVEHKYFETFIIVMILASSLALAIEDIYLEERRILKLILVIMDKFFTVIFILEMLIKWCAFGYKKYFTDAWCWLDFVIVCISLIMLGAEAMGMGNIGPFKAMRTLRALRPLRAVSRWEGMRVVVNALIKAIPSIFNVLLVCLVFWLIFGIVGVQFFSGKFHKCWNLTEDARVDASIVPNKSMCNGTDLEWRNSDINFDNVANAYLALLQVATYKGWIEIMADAVDITGDDKQPIRESSSLYYLYFVLFIIFGSFFTLNLFIGVIIENFNQQKKKAGGSLEMFMTEDQKKYYKAMKKMAGKSPQKSIPRPEAGSLEMFMTEDQKKYYQAMKKMSDKAPQKSIPRPSVKIFGWIFDLVTNQKFDIGIMVIIMANMITMMLESHNMTDEFENILYWINLSFIVIFTVECVLKIIGLRHYYFKFPWNVFDFVVVILSILGVAMADFMEQFLISPTLLRVVRVFRVSRVLRLVKSAKGIRTLLFSLAVSLPALFNIGLLLFLVIFIYATFGMNFFMHVKKSAGIDDAFNFETFGRSVIVLFQMCTSAGWNGVLAGLMNEKDCDEDKNECGNKGLAVFYLVTYLVISFLVVVNMYIAVILENFSQATEDVQQGLTPEDFDMYYEKWEKYDPGATQFIDLKDLSDFVDYLEEPLRLQKPNHFMLVKLDIPICADDKCFCKDILDALTRNFLGTSDTGDIENMNEANKEKKKEVDHTPVSSTLMRQKEHYAARIIQKAFRKYRHLRGDLPPALALPPTYSEACEAVTSQEQEPSEEDHLLQNEDKEHLSGGDIQEEKKEDVKIMIEDGAEDNKEDDSEATEVTTNDARAVELRPESGVVA